MDNEKDTEFEARSEAGGETLGGGSAPRARNRTVMLTPEITGEVRARLARDGQDMPARHAPPEHAQRHAPESRHAPGRPEGHHHSSHGGGYGAPGRVPPAPAMEPDRHLGHAPVPSAQPAAPVRPTIAAPVAPRGDRIVWHKEAKLVGFLVSFDRSSFGEFFEIRSGRIIVTSEAAASGNFLVLTDDTVSPMHAILRVGEDGAIQVLDQLSENGTTIVRRGGQEQQLSGDKGSLGHGDVVVFGKRRFNVCLIEVAEEE